MSGGRAPRQKAGREERMLVAYAQSHGFAATRRVPLSGSAPGFPGDISFPLLNRERVVESKVRRDGFRELYKWIEQRDLLVLRSDRRPALVVMRLSDAMEIAKAAENNKV
jgi:hypothetical protein